MRFQEPAHHAPRLTGYAGHGENFLIAGGGDVMIPKVSIPEVSVSMAAPFRGGSTELAGGSLAGAIFQGLKFLAPHVIPQLVKFVGPIAEGLGEKARKALVGSGMPPDEVETVLAALEAGKVVGEGFRLAGSDSLRGYCWDNGYQQWTPKKSDPVGMV